MWRVLRMKKWNKVVVMVICLCIGRTIPVFAISEGIQIEQLLATIENGLTMVSQLQAMYNQLETNYQALQKQKEGLMSMKLDELDATDPLGSWGSLMTYADRMMTYEDNIDAIMNTKTFKFGQNSVSMKELFTTNPVGPDGIVTDSFQDPFTMYKTPEERAAFNSKYGISYEHAMRIESMKTKISEEVGQASTYFSTLIENMNEDRARLDTIAATDAESESTISQQQRANALMISQAQDIKTLAYGMSQIGQIVADQAFADKVSEDAVKAQKIMAQNESSANYLEITKVDESKFY